jgi:hypothetical protein
MRIFFSENEEKMKGIVLHRVLKLEKALKTNEKHDIPRGN